MASIYDLIPMTKSQLEDLAEKENVSAIQYVRWFYPQAYNQWKAAQDATPTKTFDDDTPPIPGITYLGGEDLEAEQSASPFYETNFQEMERLADIAAAKKASAVDADKRLADMEKSSGQSIFAFMKKKPISYQDPETGERMSAVGESEIKALADKQGLSALQIIEQAAPNVVKDFTNAAIKKQVSRPGVQMQTSAPPPRNVSNFNNANQWSNFYRNQENQMAPQDRQPNTWWFNQANQNNPYISTVPNNWGNSNWFGYYANPFAAGGQPGPQQGGPLEQGLPPDALPNTAITSSANPVMTFTGAGDPSLAAYQTGLAGAVAANQPFWWSGTGPAGGDPGMATGDPSFQDWGMAGEERDIARAAAPYAPTFRDVENRELWELGLEPSTIYRRYMQNLYNPTPAERLVSSRNLGVGFYPAYGSYLLGRAATAGGGREETEEAGFQRFLQSGLGRGTPLGARRSQFAGLAQSLADPSGTGAYGIYGGFMPGEEGFGDRMIGAAEAALGTGGSARNRLNRIYGSLSEMYGPTEAASKFADFVGSAFR